MLYDGMMDKIKKRRRSQKSISREHIFGNVSFCGFVIIVGGLAFFLCLNGYLAFFLTSSGVETSSFFPFLIPLLQRSQCAPYGCIITPPEFDADRVQKAIEANVEAPFGSWRAATLTRTSNRKAPPFNQDAAVMIRPYRTAQTLSDDDFLIGIFDGHGALGHINAKHFAADIPERLARKFNKQRNRQQSTDWVMKQLRHSFVEADAEAPREMTLRGGCTGSVTLRRGHRLYFANVGDSRTILASVDATKFQIAEQGPAPGVTMHYITRADKPHLPEEINRIHSLGGNVHVPLPPKNPNLSRVIVYSNTFNDTIGLAMSRSLGDYEWSVKGVIAEPLVDMVDLQSSNFTDINRNPTASLFIIAASDGLWDLRLKQWVAKQFAESFLGEQNPRTTHPLRKMKEIIVTASPQNQDAYRDDITAIVMKVS